MKALAASGALAIVVLATSALVGCGNGGGGTSGGGFSNRKAEGGNGASTFRYPIVTAPTTLDPHKTQDGDTLDVVQQVFEGLVKWGEDNSVQPNLAEKWEIDPAGTLYTFKLRPNVKFSNGRAMTADDVKWSFERACDPKFASPTAGTYLSDIVGVRERLAGKATSVSGIKVVDPATVTIQIDKTRPYFLGKLTYACAYVVAKEALPDPTATMTKPEQMIGTGPFVFDTIDTNRLVTLKAFKEYHEGAPKVERIERPVVLDAVTRLNMYKQGQIDLIPLERQDVKSIQADPKLKDDLKFFDRPSTWYIGFNCDKVPALKDPRVRRALGMAIDKKTIVDGILGGQNTIANGIVPPGVFGYREDVKGLPFDVNAAKALLAQAGYPGGKGIGEIEFSYRDGRPDVELVAQAVQQQWKEALGVSITLQKREWGSYLQKYNAKDLPAFHMRWGADYLDAENFLSTLLASYGGENKISYKNARYDALCREADTILDEAKRKELYAQAEDLVIQDAPFIPIYFQKDAELIRGNVKGLRESLFGHLPHTTVSID